jgi:hypothetical protein
LVRACSIRLAPNYLETPATAAVLYSNVSAGFNTAMQAGEARAAPGNIKGPPLLNVNIPVRIERPDGYQMLGIFPIVAAQIHVPKW